MGREEVSSDGKYLADKRSAKSGDGLPIETLFDSHNFI
jgi:hypothetical protein